MITPARPPEPTAPRLPPPASGWERTGRYMWQRGPWRITVARVAGVPGYCLTHDDDTYTWCGVTLYRMRHYDTPEAARAAAELDAREDSNGHD